MMLVMMKMLVVILVAMMMMMMMIVVRITFRGQREGGGGGRSLKGGGLRQISTNSAHMEQCFVVEIPCKNPVFPVYFYVHCGPNQITWNISELIGNTGPQ